MNAISAVHHTISRLFFCLLCLGGSQLSFGQVADLGEIGTDPRRAFFVEVQISEDSSAGLVRAFVAGVPPGTHAAEPPMIGLEYLDAADNVIMRRNAWDPRREHGESLDGEELRVDLPVATGFFDIVFRSDIARVRVTDNQTTPPLLLLDVDVSSVVMQYCIDNPADSACLVDQDGDSVPDRLDNCPENANSDQIDTDADGMGNACDPDDDNDGVDDNVDQCPATAAGEAVGSDGCPLNEGDEDNDGLADADDRCPGTVIPESVPTDSLRDNRYALTSNNVADPLIFESTNKNSLSVKDTGGCSCEQIITALSLGKGHSKYGCTSSVMDDWRSLGNQN